MFRAFFIFDAPAIVLATEARLGFLLGIFQFLSTFVAKFKINFRRKEIVPGERGCTVCTRLRFQDGGRAAYSDCLVIVGREMIHDLPDPGPIEEKKILAKMARMTCMAHPLARMARWLADLADPNCTHTVPDGLLC